MFAQQSAKVSRIEFTGNDFFSSRELANFMTTKENTVFTQQQFELDLKNIIVNYQNEGFINCTISDHKKDYNFDSSSVSLSITVNEGKQILVGEINFDGNKLFKTSFLKESMSTKEGQVLDALSLNRDLTDILNLYEKSGYTFATINVASIEEYTAGSNSRLRISIKVSENERIKIDNIVVEGNTSTNKEVITREIRLGKNNTVTKEDLLEIKRKLENLGYFESVDQPKILKYKNSTVLQIRVKEGNTNTFDGILGYVPPAANEETGYFTGIVNLSIRNLFGTGRKIEAKFQKEIRTTQELELKYLEPWIFSLPVNVNLGFLQRIEDSSFIKRDLSVKSDAILSARFTLSLLLHYERIIPTIQNTYLNTFDSRVLAAGLELRFDNRDYVYNPFSGILTRMSYTVGQKKIYNASAFVGQDVPPEFTVQRIIGDFDFYNSLFKRQSSLVGLHVVEIISPRFEIADLYRFGGVRSVRGYRDGQFLAARSAWGNLELRYSLTRRSFLFGFYDLGYYLTPYDPTTQLAKQEGFIYGYGLGIRIETALGMFGVSYALGRGDSILEGKIHFGLVNDF